jgi:hypothetical protein
MHSAELSLHLPGLHPVAAELGRAKMISAGICLRIRAAETTYSAALLFHGHKKVEDVPIRVTDVEGTMAPRLGCELLNPLQL